MKLRNSVHVAVVAVFLLAGLNISVQACSGVQVRSYNQTGQSQTLRFDLTGPSSAQEFTVPTGSYNIPTTFSISGGGATPNLHVQVQSSGGKKLSCWVSVNSCPSNGIAQYVLSMYPESCTFVPGSF